MSTAPTPLHKAFPVGQGREKKSGDSEGEREIEGRGGVKKRCTVRGGDIQGVF